MLCGTPAISQLVGVTAPTVADRSERITRATVSVIVGDRAVAQGVVLAGDGRVVTARIPLAGARSVNLRYATGRTGAGTVVSEDETWGLVLVQPRTGAWPGGLALATRVRWNTPIRWALGEPPHSVAAILRRRRTYVNAREDLLRDAWECDPWPEDAAAGSGVANAAGELVAVLVPAGRTQGPFGVPVPVVQRLIERAGLTARPWLGLVARTARPEDTAALQNHGLPVTDVAAGSPAHTAGIRRGDVIVGSGERSIEAVQDLGAVLEPLHPGDDLPLRIIRRGATVDRTVHLEQFPPLEP